MFLHVSTKINSRKIPVLKINQPYKKSPAPTHVLTGIDTPPVTVRNLPPVLQIDYAQTG